MPRTLKRTAENAELSHKQRKKRFVYAYENTMEYVTKL